MRRNGKPIDAARGDVQHRRRDFVNRIRFRYAKTSSRSPEGVRMKIGSQAQRSSAISASNAETIVVRGRDLCGELVGAITFTDHVWLLITGQLPNAAQRRVLDATLVAIAEHGLVPSVAASRMTLAAAPEALQGAVAAGILGCGSVILGSAESAARLLRGDRGAREARGPGSRRACRARRAADRAPAGARVRPPVAQAAGSARGAAARRGHRGRCRGQAHRDRRAGRAPGAGDLEPAAGHECFGRDCRGAAGRRLSTAGGQGRTHAGAHRRA